MLAEAPIHGRLASLPAFLKSPAFWKGSLDPRASLDVRTPFGHMREFSSGHAWGLNIPASQTLSPPTETELLVIEVALGILQRGAWCPCSWGLEQELAQRMTDAGLVTAARLPQASGLLGFQAEPSMPRSLSNALISARLATEVQGDAAEQLWLAAVQETGFEGSDQEWQFFSQVLVPVLGFPLLDYLSFQTSFVDLGVDPALFARQRTDFSIDTGRGLRLVIEVDGRQHLDVVAQRHLDVERDLALKRRGWLVWRVRVSELHELPRHRSRLQRILEDTPGAWGTKLQSAPARSPETMTAVWGATVSARIQFLLLVAMQRGLLKPDQHWAVEVQEGETDVGALAVTDFLDWFGRLRGLYGLPDLPGIELAERGSAPVNLTIAVSCTNPHLGPENSRVSSAWSRPANRMVPEPVLAFSGREYVRSQPERELLESFAQDLFRKAGLREGQYEILSRILQGRDAVGLLPTGGGKSLTYQLASLLLPGATLYVAPLKSLLQDQFERLKSDGVDSCGFISSALNTSERKEQEARFQSGRMRMLQVAPERFLMPNFRNLLTDYQARFGGISQVVVDECHCVSEWGHDFRPAYLSLSRIVRDRTARLGSSAPVVALTGTASSIVLDDVRRELGITDSASIIRARRLDRPELELVFEAVPVSGKRKALSTHVQSFLELHRGTSGGCLVFTQHVNGTFGVHELASEAVRTLGLQRGSDIRIYSGDVPKALKDTVTKQAWDLEKAEAQRDFISPRDNSFQVLVATSAFGMGIDKPSIRQVVHYLAPASPEAYYQEVGRAARDGEPARAVLLFSDEASELADKVLSPSATIDDAQAAYKSVSRGMNVGDFLTTFFFHSSRFTGVDEEVASARAGLEVIKSLLDTEQSLAIKYRGDKKAAGWDSKATLEYSLVRLIHLGVVQDYTIDYNASVIEVVVDEEWKQSRSSLERYRERFITHLEVYFGRYETRRAASLLQPLAEAVTLEDVEGEALKAIVAFLYQKIERRRRTSTRTMLELVREGVNDASVARTRLLFYLQASEKFTHDLEQMAQGAADGKSWLLIAEAAVSPVEVDELRGATARVLESYPTHPGLLLLGAITRRNPSDAELERSKEDFKAAVDLITEANSADEAADAAEHALNICAGIDQGLEVELRCEYVLKSYRLFGARYALSMAEGHSAATMSVVREMLSAARVGLPERQI
jgi:ATP-dependent DNA helicase RecQ